MGGIPSIPTDPSRKVEVIGAGFSRTGTVTFALAMEKLLDGPVMHGGTQMLGREDGNALSFNLIHLNTRASLLHLFCLVCLSDQVLTYLYQPTLVN